MKHNQWILIIAAFSLSAMVPSPVRAQDWTPEQLEVWQAVDDCYRAVIDRDEVTHKACYHEDYSFWWAEDVLPFGKNRVDNYWAHRHHDNPIEAVDVRPVAIVVHGDAALVHWGAIEWTRDSDGERGEFVERISMMLVRQNGRWQYFGGGGSPFEK